MRRRDILRGIAGAACVSVGGTVAFPALADTLEVDARRGLSNKLASALRLVGGEVCTIAAYKLENSQGAVRKFNLHLRRAGLNKSDILIVARALRSLTAPEAALLKSFSVSYNPDIEDEGAIALAQSMPPNIRDVGLVGCDLGDAGGTALLEWVNSAADLQMICIEENRFSDQLKQQFVALREKDKSLLVIV